MYTKSRFYEKGYRYTNMLMEAVLRNAAAGVIAVAVAVAVD